ncbi:hypothetical protein RhiirC2_793150 [Rhizophagus irregularis]|uniref:Uncharacterized protein n=1 Tax=Rhizophagus irregularis TaxID=588596 RepID=A0A2N1MFY7_9GLOM|nr:hypothetical protein RhiirC2_793150 [Rhizophagus irregularis]
MLSVESSEIPKDPRTNREKSPTGPFVLITPFDVDRERSLVKSISFTPANREKFSTNRENSLVRTAHTETSVSTTLTPSVTPMSYERTSRTPTSILSLMQINVLGETVLRLAKHFAHFRFRFGPFRNCQNLAKFPKPGKTSETWQN